MRPTLRGILFAVLLLAACEGVTDIVSPGPHNRTNRIFSRPFEGQFLNSWPFDHDLPLGAIAGRDADVQGSPHVLTWRGETLVLPWGDGRHHDGYDWVVPEGTPLLAVGDGEVVFAGREPPFTCGSRGEVAALIVGIRHEARRDEVYESRYVHLSRIDVSVGDRVEAGQPIGLSGRTGCTSGPHLHFSVFRHLDDGTKVVVDPFGWEGDFTDPWEARTGVKSLWLWKRGEVPDPDYSFQDGDER